MFAYRIDELRLPQERAQLSAIDALLIQTVRVPVGKIWTLMAGIYGPSASETRTIQVSKVLASGSAIPIRVPQSILLSALIGLPIVTEGNQIILLPNERIQINRDVATAGSTMYLSVQIIESDMPIARFIEPQRELSIKRRLRGFAPLSNLGVTRAVMGSDEGGGENGGVPGEGGGLPV